MNETTSIIAVPQRAGCLPRSCSVFIEPPREEGVWRLTNLRGSWLVKIDYIMGDWHGQYLIDGQLVGAWCVLRWWPVYEYGMWEKQND